VHYEIVLLAHIVILYQNKIGGQLDGILMIDIEIINLKLEFDYVTVVMKELYG
jgi:hypothetical protein